MILILGGTGEAHQIASSLQGADIDFIVSMAGVTRKRVERSYLTRVGGFGGVDGLAEYLGKREIKGLIDATHPFAATISKSGFLAAQKTDVPLIRYIRPEWDVSAIAGCRTVPNLEEAARDLPGGARAFLTVGGNSIGPFIHRTDVWFLFRGIEPMENPFSQGEALVQRPPFTLKVEKSLMKNHAITHLVTKNSGGVQTRAKIDAAIELGIPVILVERPVLPVVENASTVLDILRWAQRIQRM